MRHARNQSAPSQVKKIKITFVFKTYQDLPIRIWSQHFQIPEIILSAHFSSSFFSTIIKYVWYQGRNMFLGNLGDQKGFYWIIYNQCYCISGNQDPSKDESKEPSKQAENPEQGDISGKSNRVI